MSSAVMIDNISGYVGALELAGEKDTREGWREYINEDNLCMKEENPDAALSEEQIEAVIRWLEEDGYVV